MPERYFRALSDDIRARVDTKWCANTAGKLASYVLDSFESAAFDKGDESPYVGRSGIAYMMRRMSLSPFLSDSERARYQRAAEEIMGDNLPPSLIQEASITGPSILCGLAGWIVTMAYVSPTIARRYAPHFTELGEIAADKRFVADEFLYGRAGFLFACLLLRKSLGEEIVPESAMRPVFNAMVGNGRKISAKKRARGMAVPPLMYEWYGSDYIGAAHGLMGILYVMLHCGASVGGGGSGVGVGDGLSKVSSEYGVGMGAGAGAGSNAKSPMRAFSSSSSAHSQHELWVHQDAGLLAEVEESLDFVLGLWDEREENYPTLLGDHHHNASSSSSSPTLIHWCHGAPGAIFLWTRAFEVFGEEKYRRAAEKAGDSVWRRGLLKKGPGLCHGVSGNGYAFLRLYRATGDRRHLHRAYRFAQFMSTQDFEPCMMRPDAPLSLYEGLSGAACFTSDLALDPDKARFPLFEV